MLYKDEFIVLMNNISKEFSCKIANFMIKLNVENNMTYIGINNSTFNITYVSDKKLQKIVNSTLDKWSIDTYDLDDNFKLEVIQDLISENQITEVTIKVGRFIKKLTNQFTDEEIEQFVANFKALLKIRNNEANLEIVSGEDIRKFYLEKNYSNKKGNLGQSCMRHANCQKFFDIYVDNNDICQLIILKDPFHKDKIIGRALLWTLNDGTKYMDRVYTSLDCDKIIFEKYAKNNLGCAYTYNIFTSLKTRPPVLIINPKNTDYEYYPYMDTFAYFYPTKNLLISEDFHKKGYYVLDTIDGSLDEENF